MSRSKHTDPLAIRAMRRMRSPWEPRKAGDLSLRQKTGQLLKELGVASRPILKTPESKPVGPRIILQTPRTGFLHPVGRSDVQGLLEFVGPEAMYGLQSIEFLRAPEFIGPHSLGQFEVPGRIIVYEQPLLPWHISGIVAEDDVLRFRQSGAHVEYRESPDITIIDWPGDTLREFMLFDVLLHELGHHILQHNKGKRRPRIARTRDHESFAANFARRCHEGWIGRGFTV